MERKRGAYPEYSIEDAIAVIILLKEPLGRKQIAEKLELGEGTVRTLLKKLAKLGMIDSKQRGHFLTEKGKRVRENLLELFSEPIGVSVDGYPAIGIVVRKPPSFKSIELRDEAIRFDAKGAMILIVKNGEIVFPEDLRPLRDMYPDIARKIVDYDEGDAVVITWADTPPKAFKSAIHVAYVMKKDEIPGEVMEVVR
ncbi:DUF4443 domain-containing protein [Pyrococcus abyssi]|uniref:Uncharacterized protein n=1 Tax=Pyrococcus abyssi (strain GE5 / Orsay) TaxID=272844 RepID=Q9UZ34_PYRAB|nr:DUF4443 domain-containing protein [Pyrococcus abyssi]CAB50225.1 Hypothetical protein PAB1504 [Pyrococcus abyssi GE5]CCE70761.1 TPA: hypothetical protein PAB1504 [Pyrococcus abyssi GE5]